MMEYRKLKGTNIFDGTQFLGVGNVLVTLADGTIEAILPVADAGENVEDFDGILCPGFINTHCHIELSHLKNQIPIHTGLVNFVQKVIALRASTDAEKQAAMQQAAQELYNSGTVAVGDICNTADSIALKKDSPIYWHNFIEVSGFVPAAAQKRFDEACITQQQFSHAAMQQVITAHSPYSVSKELFNLINTYSTNQTISIHNQECLAENEFLQKGTGHFLNLYKNFGIDISNYLPSGKTSLQTWLPYFTENQKIIAIHNTFTTKEDVVFAQQQKGNDNLFFCLCPNANLYIENTLPNIEMLLEQHLNIVLGTDSYASNWQLNIFEEIKTIQKHFATISLQHILQWATLNGAMALGISDVYGSFAKGKKPGVVLIGDGEVRRVL